MENTKLDMGKRFLFLVGFLFLMSGVVMAANCSNDSECSEGYTCNEGACIFGKTVFSGIIYKDKIGGNFSADSEVIVLCGDVLGNDTTDDSDGSYSISFLKRECNSSHSYIVNASKGAFFVSSGELNDIDDSDNSGVVKNLAFNITVKEKVSFFGKIFFANGSSAAGMILNMSCDNISKNGTSGEDGSYSVNFLKSECKNSFKIEAKDNDGDYSGQNESLKVEGDEVNVFIEKEASCSDGIQNGDESGVDCGGSCNACDDGSSGKKEGSSGGSGGGWVNPHCSEGFHVGNFGNGVIGCIPDVLENVTLEDLNISEADFNEHSSEPGFWDKFLVALTGGVIGAGTSSWVAGGLFALLVLVLYLYVKKKMVK